VARIAASASTASPPSAAADAPLPALPAVPSADDDAAEPQVVRAFATARDALLARPDDASRWGRLGVLFHAHLRPTEARACYARAEGLDPADVRWTYLLALLAARAQPDEALDRLDRVLDREPRFIPALVRAGDLLRLLDRPADARPRYEQAVALDPRCAAAHLALAQLDEAAGDLDSAVAHARRAAAAVPSHAEPARELARLLGRTGRAADGPEQAALAALALTLPADVDLLSDPLLVSVAGENVSRAAVFRRARRHHAAGRVALAVAELDRLLGMTPADIDALALRALARRDLRDIEGARADVAEALRLRPQDADLTRLAEDLARLGAAPGGATAPGGAAAAPHP
jgi:tetratricopeptide (TPR) repeat protein